MDDLRYAVGGSPIAHTLSPILLNLVLKDLQNKGHFSKLDVSSMTVIDANHIDEVLGIIVFRKSLQSAIPYSAVARL